MEKFYGVYISGRKPQDQAMTFFQGVADEPVSVTADRTIARYRKAYEEIAYAIYGEIDVIQVACIIEMQDVEQPYDIACAIGLVKEDE